jgi:hypothetical protein
MQTIVYRGRTFLGTATSTAG